MHVAGVKVHVTRGKGCMTSGKVHVTGGKVHVTGGRWEGACDRCEGAYLPRCAIAMPHGSHDGIHHLTGQVQVPEVISLDETISKRRPLCSTPASPQCMSCKNWYI